MKDWKTVEYSGPVLGPALTGVIAPEIHRTAPYSFGELAARWSCSVDTVERVVGHRCIKIGRTRMVRPQTLLKLEETLEGSR